MGEKGDEFGAFFRVDPRKHGCSRSRLGARGSRSGHPNGKGVEEIGSCGASALGRERSTPTAGGCVILNPRRGRGQGNDSHKDRLRDPLKTLEEEDHAP